MLGSDFVLRPAVPPERAQAVLAEMAAYLKGGAQPKTEEVREFLQNLAIDALLELAGPANQDLLRAMTLFGLPVPEAALAAFVAELGGRRPRDCVTLGLLAPAEDVVAARVALAANGLAAGRLIPLTASEQATLAKLALPTLFPLWGGAEDRLRRPYAADIELTRLALLADDVSVLRVCAGDAVRGLVENGRPAAAGELGQAAIAAIEAAGDRPSLRLLARTAQALQTAGEGAAAEAVLAKGAAQTGAEAEPEDLGQLSNFLFTLGRRQRRAGDLDAAMATFERLCEVERRRANEHQLAVARGSIADILRARGELDEALRIRTEEQLPVFQRLGDVREVAVTQSRIADILEARGELDEALALHEECLATNRRLGDIDAIAASLWSIAQIELDRQQFEQALPRLAEAWPLVVKLGRPDGIAAAIGRSPRPTPRHCRRARRGPQRVLGQAAAAYHALGRATEAAEIEAMMADINKRQG